jgi:hypothetical protein
MKIIVRFFLIFFYVAMNACYACKMESKAADTFYTNGVKDYVKRNYLKDSQDWTIAAVKYPYFSHGTVELQKAGACKAIGFNATIEPDCSMVISLQEGEFECRK